MVMVHLFSFKSKEVPLPIESHFSKAFNKRFIRGMMVWYG